MYRPAYAPTACLAGALCFLVALAAGAEPSDDLPDIGSSYGAIISPEMERRMGADFMRQMRRYAPIVTDEEAEEYIQNLGDSLAQYADFDGEFTFFLVESNVINAFAVPGGYIGMHTGLILNSKSESEVASVLGHEIVHVTQHHTARMIEEQQRKSGINTLATLAAIAMVAVSPEAGMGALLGTQAVQAQQQINFTRANEREADRIGIRLLYEAGYDTQAMGDFFEKMQRASRYTDPDFIPEILRSHPVTTNRIAEARQRADQLGSAQIREDSYDYYLIWTKLNVAAARDPAFAKRYYQNALKTGDFQHDSIARYGYILALTANSEFDRARIEVEKLLLESPGIMAFRLAAARLEKRAGNVEAALAHFAQAFEENPDSRAALYPYTEMLTEAGDPRQAKKLLRENVTPEDRDPKFYAILAEAEDRMGQKANSHYSLSEYYRVSGEVYLAVEQLRLAKVTPDLSNYQRHRVDARLEELNKEIAHIEEAGGGRRRH